MIKRGKTGKISHGILGLIGLGALSFPLIAAGPASHVTRISGHVPTKAISQSQDLGHLTGSQKISLSVALNVNDESALEQLIARLNTPGDPLYGRYLSPQQFTEQFAPSEQDYNQVVQYLSGLGLTVESTQPNRLLINVSGPSSTIESAFQVSMHQYVASDGRIAFASTSDPMIDDSVAPKIRAVAGLQNLTQFKSYAHPLAKGAKPQQVGSGPNGGLAPADIKKAYNLAGLTQTGAGQTLGLFELDGYTASDITGYASHFGIATTPTLQNVLVDTATGTPGSGATEVTLDIELMVAIAPGATKILVYEGPNSEQGLLDTYAKIANDNLAKNVSTSWGIPEDQATATMLASEKTIFMQMAAQGQSIYAAAGDSGAYDDGTNLSVDDPGSDPYVVSTGGTTLSLSGAQAYTSESSWGIPASGSTAAQGGGGGISATWPIPSWQMGLGNATNLGSTTMRMVPDISLDANPNTGYAIFFQGAFGIVGGTSCAAPVWAAFTALVNQQRAANGSPVLGYPNPALYQLALSQNYGNLFHDVSDATTNLHYPAEKGYDLSSGWGSMNGATLFAALVNPVLPPLAPATLSLATHYQVMALSWVASSGATSYTVSRGTAGAGPFTPVATNLTALSYQDTGLTNGTTYYYEVSAINASGQSAFSMSSGAPSIVVPQAPTNFTVVNVGAQ